MDAAYLLCREAAVGFEPLFFCGQRRPDVNRVVVTNDDAAAGRHQLVEGVLGD